MSMDAGTELSTASPELASKLLTDKPEHARRFRADFFMPCLLWEHRYEEISFSSGRIKELTDPFCHAMLCVEFACLHLIVCPHLIEPCQQM